MVYKIPHTTTYNLRGKQYNMILENTTYNNIGSMWEAIKYGVENTTYNNIEFMWEAIKYDVENTTYNNIESMWEAIK